MHYKKIVISVALIKSGPSYICLRRNSEPYYHYLEFPGGKIIKGESPSLCLSREISEELDITIKKHKFIGTIKHLYDNVLIEINVFKVFRYDRLIHSNEGHKIVLYNSLSNDNILPTHHRILNLLKLPRLLKIFNSCDFINIKELDISCYTFIRLRGINYQFYQKYIKDELISQRYKGAIIIDYPYNLDWKCHYDGIHFSSKNLCKFEIQCKDPKILYSASCHTKKDIELCNKMLFDFILISPVLQSHSKYNAIDWPGFSKLCELSYAPAYALGGLSSNYDDINISIKNRGFGIAGISQI